jgi:collagenase-like PrtC family protease
MNNIFKTKDKVEIDSNFHLETDTFSGVCLVKSYPAKRKDNQGKETDYIATERFYYNTVAQALEKYMELKQIILPSIVEMLEVQKEIAEVLKQFRENYKNW